MLDDVVSGSRWCWAWMRADGLVLGWFLGLGLASGLNLFLPQNKSKTKHNNNNTCDSDNNFAIIGYSIIILLFI